MKVRFGFVFALSLVLLLCCNAFASTLVPSNSVSSDPLADGTYTVNADFCLGNSTKMIVDVFVTNYYDAALVESLQPGDTIRDGIELFGRYIRTIEVDDEGIITINGDSRNSEVFADDSFMLYPEGDKYTLHTGADEDGNEDTPACTSVSYEIELADTVHLKHLTLSEDGTYFTEDTTETDLAATDVKPALAYDNGDEGSPLMSCMNTGCVTTITISGGKITSIDIGYSE